MWWKRNEARNAAIRVGQGPCGACKNVPSTSARGGAGRISLLSRVVLLVKITSTSNFYVHLGKRLLDLLVTVPVAFVTLPLQAVVGIAVGLRLGKPILYRQQRPGHNGEPFEMIKFRTMTDERDEQGSMRPDAQRLTSLGTR